MELTCEARTRSPCVKFTCIADMRSCFSKLRCVARIISSYAKLRCGDLMRCSYAKLIENHIFCGGDFWGLLQLVGRTWKQPGDYLDRYPGAL